MPIQKHTQAWVDRSWNVTVSQMPDSSPWKPWTPRSKTTFRVTQNADVKELVSPAVKNKDRGKKGIFTTQGEAKSNAMVKSLLLLGMLEEARRKARAMEERNIPLDAEVRALFNSTQEADEQGSWRSPWKTPLTLDRGDARYEQGMLLEDLRDWRNKKALLLSQKANEQARQQRLVLMSASAQELHNKMEKVSMWEIMIHIPWKRKTITMSEWLGEKYSSKCTVCSP
jgi:hypothetical protein